jgi:peptidyl-prolyl cis-trans isomerase A (cyclophilin A)
VRVRLETGFGPITLELEKERAPGTTANFLRYVDGRRLDGTGFYRALKVGADAGLIQGGVGRDGKRLLPPIAHEPTTQTGLSHTDGAVSMARLAPGSAAGDFFITIGGLPSLDADPAASGDTQGFAVFGRVVEGMDVVHRILEAPVSPTAGEGAMRGQILAQPVKIISARRLPPAR